MGREYGRLPSTVDALVNCWVVLHSDRVLPHDFPLIVYLTGYLQHPGMWNAVSTNGRRCVVPNSWIVCIVPSPITPRDDL